MDDIFGNALKVKRVLRVRGRRKNLRRRVILGEKAEKRKGKMSAKRV